MVLGQGPGPLQDQHRLPAGPLRGSSPPARRRSQANLACKAGMTHLLAFSLPRLHPGGCSVLPSLICTEVGGGR